LRGSVLSLTRGLIRPIQPRQFKVQAGNIMFTESTHPGWKLVFGLLGELIMESGEELLHGAVGVKRKARRLAKSKAALYHQDGS